MTGGSYSKKSVSGLVILKAWIRRLHAVFLMACGLDPSAPPPRDPGLNLAMPFGAAETICG
jgi:hypothetical protein